MSHDEEQRDNLSDSEELKVRKIIDARLMYYARLFGVGNLLVVAGAIWYCVAIVPDQAADIAVKRVGSVQKVVDGLATDASRRLADLSRQSADESVRLKQIQTRLDEIEKKLAAHYATLSSVEKERRALQQRIRILATADVTKASDILQQIEQTPTAAEITKKLAILGKYEFSQGSKLLTHERQVLEFNDGKPVESDSGEVFDLNYDLPAVTSIPVAGVPRNAVVVATFEFEGSAPQTFDQLVTRNNDNGNTTSVRYNEKKQRHEIDVSFVYSASIPLRVNWFAMWPRETK